jgi:hypothetical protein
VEKLEGPDILQESPDIFSRFCEVADSLCAVVDAAQSMSREDLVLEISQLLPLVIGEAISLPAVEPGDSSNRTEIRKARITQEQWGDLYSLLKEKLGDWNLYSQVFDPTKDREAIDGSLADDIADIYRDLKGGLVVHHSDLAPSTDILWEWRLGFYSHWGKHAIDALRTIHFLLEDTLS